ncbi:MAG: putative ferric reductase [Desulforhopalus sp.]|jgi:predicted ferric reductase
MDLWKKTTVVIIFLLALVSALSLPYTYESQTLWYKFGLDKTILRTGQLAGMLALTLLFTQIVLAVGGPFLEKGFGLKNIMSWHRTNGVLILFFALTHVFLILVPEGLANLPIGKKFWPEMVGSLLLWILVVMVISSRYRAGLKLDYRRWRSIHKPLGYLAIFLVVIHVLYVSDSFEQVVPRRIFLGTVVVFLSRVLWVKVHSQIEKRGRRSIK